MDFLKEYLGEELYNKVAEKLKDNDKVKLANLASGEYVGKDKFTASEENIKQLNKQLKDRDKQLDELKKIDAEGLKAEIEELQEANKTTQTEYEGKLQKQQFDFILDKSLGDAKAKNTKAIKALLDMDTIKLDGESLKGLDDQLKKLAESDSYLFDSDDTQTQQTKPTFSQPNHQKQPASDQDAWNTAFAPPSFGSDK